jgi:glycosyltransferase involved in cell wall biosynthesis
MHSLKLIDLTFYMHEDIHDPDKAIRVHEASVGYARYLGSDASAEIIIHMDYEGQRELHGITYSFFKSKNSFFHIPRKTLKYVRSIAPDIILVHGLIFPVQVLALRYYARPSCKIICIHHAEGPSLLKWIFYKMANRSVDSYIFSAREIAKPWIKRKIIPEGKCKELVMASTSFRRKNRSEARMRLGIPDKRIFLWVGRLSPVKDPVTVIRGFSAYIRDGGSGSLYMIYQDEELTDEIRKIIEEDIVLKKAIIPVGAKPHDELEWWYSAADYYLSGSRSEAIGYSLIEAMACGCIPVVTDIPSFRKIIGSYGYLYDPGNAAELKKVLVQLADAGSEDERDKIAKHFESSLSFSVLAEKITGI